MPRNIDPAPDTRSAAQAAAEAVERYRNATEAHQTANCYAHRAMCTGKMHHIQAARNAYAIAAKADEDAAIAARLSANHASHASSAFGMKGTNIV